MHGIVCPPQWKVLAIWHSILAKIAKYVYDLQEDWVNLSMNSDSLDNTDRKLLDALQHDARQTVADLAQLVSLSPSPCWRRVRQLEEAGVIEGYHAQLSRAKLGYGVTGFVHLQMDNHSPDIMAAFEREVGALAQGGREGTRL